MKYLLLLALFTASFTLPAQNRATNTTTSSNTSVSESETNDGYAFKLKVDRQQMDDVMSAYIKFAEVTGISKIVGVSSFTTDDGAVMMLNTRKRTLRIYSDKEQPASMADARGLADQVREELGIAPAPAPPGF